MNKKLLILMTIFVLLGCRQSENIKIVEEKYELKSQICEGQDCAKVEIEIPNFLKDDKSIQPINDEIFRQVSLWVSFAENGERIESYEELMQSFIHAYERIKTSFPNEPLPWKAEIEVEVERLNHELVNVIYGCYTFTGGAHGNHGKKSQFFNTNTGKQINVKELFVNYSGFEKLVKDKFYQTYNIALEDSLEEKGFLFENNRFYLTENIMISDDEVTVYYNPYEIATYATGTTELKFKFDKVKPFLNPIYFK